MISMNRRKGTKEGREKAKTKQEMVRKWKMKERMDREKEE